MYINKEQRYGNIPWTCIHPPNTGWMDWVGGAGWAGGAWSSFYISNENNKLRSFPPALPLHTYTRAWLIIKRW